VLRAGGTAQCWGADGLGQLGEGKQAKVVPVPVEATVSGAGEILGGAGLADQSTYMQDYCVVVGGQPECWGSGVYGQLGIGKSGIAYFSAVDVKGVSTATSLATDSVGYCAIVKSGHVRCWGYNGADQVGNGHPGGIATLAVTVLGVSGARQLVSDDAGYCAIVTRGKVECWGGTGDGALGDGDDNVKAASSTARMVKGLSDVTMLASDDAGYCARRQGGAVYCWGLDTHGELGDGIAKGDSSTPVKAHIEGARSIFGADDAYCALVAGGRAKCWGNGAMGRLGDGSYNSSSLPGTVKGLSGATTLTGSLAGFCALVKGGRAECWGSDADGSLGDGHAGGSSATARGVKGLSGATELASGTTSWCALTSHGVSCWGSAVGGQLGDGRSSGQAVVAVKVKLVPA
jgi:alpha-tubulin suppressor-like RCC1 family protein